MLGKVLEIYATRWDFFLSLTWQHLCISAISTALAVLIGLNLAIGMTEFKRAAHPVESLVNLFYTIPSISMFGLLIPLSGIGDVTAVIALTVYGLLPMVRGTYAGITGIAPEVIEAAEGMGTTRFQMIWKIKIPVALLGIISALRTTVVMTIALAGIASFIGAGGLGVAIYRGITTNNMAMTVAGSLLIALMALLFDYLLGGLEKRVRRKRRLER